MSEKWFFQSELTVFDIRHLENYAKEGLRTLCIAFCVISQEFYSCWSLEYESAVLAIDNSEQIMETVCSKIEKDLILLGCTAIEDKLQEGVIETIQLLLDAGIKIWVLTGDKQETAINILFSCKLFNEKMHLLICNTTDKQNTHAWLMKTAAQLEKISTKESLQLVGLVIEGDSLIHILNDKISTVFLGIALSCHSVCACRVSPLQKAALLSLVKSNVDKVTLAIGDGANDISMIQTAHLGIGINGREGLQASMVADYSISQFRFLSRLLLVHGFYSYRRISNFVLYFFYKNIAFCFIQFWYSFYNGFSGKLLFDEWMIALFNVVFSMLPPLCIGIYDRQFEPQTLLKVPQIYQYGIHSRYFNSKIFWKWCLNGLYHSFFAFQTTLYVYKDSYVMPDGKVVDQWTVGTAIYTVAFLTIILKAALVFDSWTYPTLFCIVGSVVLYFIILTIYTCIYPAFGFYVGSGMFGLYYTLYCSPIFWYCILILPILANSRDYIWRVFQRAICPLDYHIIQEMEYKTRDISFLSGKLSLANALKKISNLKPYISRGFAFSQEERTGCNIGQAELVRLYNTDLPTTQ